MSFADWDRGRRCSGLNFSRFCWFFCYSPRRSPRPLPPTVWITHHREFFLFVCTTAWIPTSPARIKTVCSTPSCLQIAKSLYAPGFILLRGENGFKWAGYSVPPYGKLFYQLFPVGFLLGGDVFVFHYIHL